MQSPFEVRTRPCGTLSVVELTLLPGASRDDVIKRLMERDGALSTVGQGDLSRVVVSYAEWASESVRQLRHAVAPESIDRLILTPRYWGLQSAPPSTSQPAIILARFEIEEVRARVTSAIDVLRQAQDRWAPMRLPDVLVIPDTSVFVRHRRKWDRIDWRPIVHCRVEDVLVAIPLAVIGELDKKKREGAFTGYRAGASIAIINRLFGPAGNPLRMAPIVAEPTALHYGLAPRPTRAIITSDVANAGEANDDVIIRSVFNLEAQSAREAHLVTFDTRMAFAARAAGVRHVHRLDDEWLHERARPREFVTEEDVDDEL